MVSQLCIIRYCCFMLVSLLFGSDSLDLVQKASRGQWQRHQDPCRWDQHAAPCSLQRNKLTRNGAGRGRAATKIRWNYINIYNYIKKNKSTRLPNRGKDPDSQGARRRLQQHGYTRRRVAWALNSTPRPIAANATL
ncbi:hypothetical protein BCV70DRAFT_17319 [Testicularia cyperi]|uniref:Uncharacterized protein n=1 Tax=Testicularia cyperi TaxID=1882483 RepID=A0A317XYR5_9BASI|nr:hypothetical protein BCV70DRAFT_17319 [Testicularia cyperi]